MGNYCKYFKRKKMVSYDSGATWQDVTPAEYQKGALYEPNSQDCGYIGYFERWTDSGTTCNGYDLYNLQVKEISNDMTNWTATSETQLGTLIEADSAECGASYKVKGVRNTGLNYKIECDSSTTIDSVTTRGYKNAKTADIGSCATVIGMSAFYCFPYLTAVTMADTVTEIGDNAFTSTSGITKIEISSAVTTISYNAFAGCKALHSLYVRAITPPTILARKTGLEWYFLYDTRFYDGQGIIYVPSESVNAYKAASGWSRYANLIFPKRN